MLLLPSCHPHTMRPGAPASMTDVWVGAGHLWHRDMQGMLFLSCRIPCCVPCGQDIKQVKAATEKELAPGSSGKQGLIFPFSKWEN